MTGEIENTSSTPWTLGLTKQGFDASQPQRGSVWGREVKYPKTLQSEIAWALAGNADLITFDVFDTLLFRTVRSERRRIAIGENLFAKFLKKEGIQVYPHELVRARLIAQKMGFRALQVGCMEGQLNLLDIVSRQLTMLGLSSKFTSERVRIELEVERDSLRDRLRTH